MGEKLCVVVDVSKETRVFGSQKVDVVIIRMLNDDRCGCRPTTMIRLSDLDSGCCVPASEIVNGQRIWLPVDRLVDEHVFFLNPETTDTLEYQSPTGKLN